MQTESLRDLSDRNYGRNGDVADARGSTGSSKDAFSTIRLKFGNAARRHDELSQAREDLLVERSTLQSSANDVRAQRTTTMDAEVEFMNALREFFYEHGGAFPPSLSLAYDKVVEERDKLGSIEEEYLQAERTLGGLEWTYLEKERVFYQYDLQDIFADEDLETARQDIPIDSARLPPPPPPPIAARDVQIVYDAPPPPPPPPGILVSAVHGAPPPPPLQSTSLDSGTVNQQYQFALAELDRLKREFNSLRPEQSKLLEKGSHRSRTRPDALADIPGSSHLYERYSDLLNRIAQCEVKVQHLKHESMEYDSLNTLLSRRMSDPLHMDKRAVSPFETATRAQTDSVLHSALENPNMKFRIREWLLDLFKNNAIERRVYLNILEHFGIPVSDRNSLEDHAERYWPFGSTDESHEATADPPSGTPDEQVPTSIPLTQSQERASIPDLSRALVEHDIGPTDLGPGSEEARPPSSNSQSLVADAYSHNRKDNAAVTYANIGPRAPFSGLTTNLSASVGLSNILPIEDKDRLSLQSRTPAVSHPKLGILHPPINGSVHSSFASNGSPRSLIDVPNDMTKAFPSLDVTEAETNAGNANDLNVNSLILSLQHSKTTSNARHSLVTLKHQYDKENIDPFSPRQLEHEKTPKIVIDKESANENLQSGSLDDSQLVRPSCRRSTRPKSRPASEILGYQKKNAGLLCTPSSVHHGRSRSVSYACRMDATGQYRECSLWFERTFADV